MLLVGRTYRQEDVHHVHEHQDEVAYTDISLSVGSINQGAGDDVMRKHLPVILSPFLDMDDNQLLEPEGKLCKYITLQEAGKLAVWPVRP